MSVADWDIDPDDAREECKECGARLDNWGRCRDCIENDKANDESWRDDD